MDIFTNTGDTMVAKRLSDILFCLLLHLPHFSKIKLLVDTIIQFLVSILGFSMERLVFSLTKTVGEQGHFATAAWGGGDTCLALWDIFVLFALLSL